MSRKIDKKQLARLRKNAEALHAKDEAYKKHPTGILRFGS